MISEMKRATRHLDTLRERRDYLAGRLEQFGGGGGGEERAAAHYWRAEWNALRWVIGVAERAVGYDENVREQHKKNDRERLNHMFGDPVGEIDKIIMNMKGEK